MMAGHDAPSLPCLSFRASQAGKNKGTETEEPISPFQMFRFPSPPHFSFLNKWVNIVH